MEYGYISKPYIGVTVTDVSAETQSYGLPQGAAVKSIIEDSPAQQCGLQVNDIITHVNGEAVTGSNDLVKKVGSANIGDTFKLTVFRQSGTVELTLTVGEQVQSALEEETQQQEQQTLPQGGFGFPFGFGGFGF